MPASHFTPDSALDEQKRALRDLMRGVMAELDPHVGEEMSMVAQRSIDFSKAQVIAGVWPLPGEIDLLPLMLTLHQQWHKIVLPETPPRGEVLIFRRWTPGCAMIPGRFGTMYPDGEIMVPEMILVPLVAFDRAGNRLGHGAGYYDRTLAGLPGVPAIGYGYAAQQMAKIPFGPHDVKLTAILTEQEVIIPSK